MAQNDLDPLTITKFMDEKVEAFTNKIVKPLAKEYALFPSFERPSENTWSGFNLLKLIHLNLLITSIDMNIAKLWLRLNRTKSP